MAEFKQNQSVIYNQQINKVTPHFNFMRQAQNADTHALKQHRLSTDISPVCSSFVLVTASDMHLKPEGEKRAKNVNASTQAFTYTNCRHNTSFRPLTRNLPG